MGKTDEEILAEVKADFEKQLMSGSDAQRQRVAKVLAGWDSFIADPLNRKTTISMQRTVGVLADIPCIASH